MSYSDLDKIFNSDEDELAVSVWARRDAVIESTVILGVPLTGGRVLLRFFTQPGSKRAGIGAEDKFPSKDTKPATLDPLSCISKKPVPLMAACCKKKTSLSHP